MEQFKPSKSESQEQRTDIITHTSEDVILDNLHKCTEGRRTCTKEEAETMHSEFERCEAGTIFHSYTESKIPTLSQFEEQMELILQKTGQPAADDVEGLRIYNLLRGRVNHLRKSVKDYVETVVRFVRISGPMKLRDPEIFIKIDHDRRKRHDGLLNTLSGLLKLINDADRIGLADKSDFYYWHPGSDEQIPSNKIPVFSEAAIENRNLIRDWALAADFSENFNKLTVILAENKTNAPN